MPLISLSMGSAHAFSVLFTCLYVAPLYFFSPARVSFSPSKRARQVAGPHHKVTSERWRDDPDVIKARLLVVSISSACCCVIVAGLIWTLGDYSMSDTVRRALQLLGFRTEHYVSHFAYLPVPLLFAGPVYAGLLLPRRPFDFKADVVQVLYTWIGIRNYVIAPLTEEIVFRSCILAVYHLAGASSCWTVWLCPLAFGAAHLHHAWETWNRYGRNWKAARHAFLVTTIQLTYTTVFGQIASHLFLRTGSLWPAYAAHIWCNVMGFPKIAQHLGRDEKGGYRIVVIVAYVGGIIMFFRYFGALTQTAGNEYWPSSGC